MTDEECDDIFNDYTSEYDDYCQNAKKRLYKLVKKYLIELNSTGRSKTMYFHSSEDNKPYKLLKKVIKENYKSLKKLLSEYSVDYFPVIPYKITIIFDDYKKTFIYAELISKNNCFCYLIDSDKKENRNFLSAITENDYDKKAYKKLIDKTKKDLETKYLQIPYSEIWTDISNMSQHDVTLALDGLTGDEFSDTIYSANKYQVPRLKQLKRLDYSFTEIFAIGSDLKKHESLLMLSAYINYSLSKNGRPFYLCINTNKNSEKNKGIVANRIDKFLRISIPHYIKDIKPIELSNEITKNHKCRMQHRYDIPIVILNSVNQSKSVINALKENKQCAVLIADGKINDENVINIDVCDMQSNFDSMIVKEYAFISYFSNVGKHSYNREVDISYNSSSEMYRDFLYRVFIEMLCFFDNKNKSDYFTNVIEFLRNTVESNMPYSSHTSTEDREIEECIMEELASIDKNESIVDSTVASDDPIIEEPLETQGMTNNQKYMYLTSCIRDAWKNTKYKSGNYSKKWKCLRSTRKKLTIV